MMPLYHEVFQRVFLKDKNVLSYDHSSMIKIGKFSVGAMLLSNPQS